MKLQELLRILDKTVNKTELTLEESYIMNTPLWQFMKVGSLDEALSKISYKKINNPKK